MTEYVVKFTKIRRMTCKSVKLLDNRSFTQRLRRNWIESRGHAALNELTQSACAMLVWDATRQIVFAPRRRFTNSNGLLSHHLIEQLTPQPATLLGHLVSLVVPCSDYNSKSGSR